MLVWNYERGGGVGGGGGGEENVQGRVVHVIVTSCLPWSLCGNPEGKAPRGCVSQ